MITVTIVVKGSPSSGNFGHSGRPGLVGGSASEGERLIPSDAEIFSGNVYHNTTQEALSSIQSTGLIVTPTSRVQDGVYFSTISGMQAGVGSGVIVSVNLRDARLAPKASHFMELSNKYREKAHEKIWDASRDQRDVVRDQYNEYWIHSQTRDEFTKEGYDGFYQGYNVVVITNFDLIRFPTVEKQLPIEYGLPESALYQETVEKQLPINDASKQALIQIRQSMFNDDVTGLAAKVYSGEMTIGKWEESMKSLIRGLHTSVTSIKKGGWDQMSWSDWGKMGTPLREQYKYLHGFAKTIETNKDTISLKAIEARAKMYGNAAQATGDIVNTDAEIRSKLPWMPRDGSTECLVNCLCRWQLQVLNKTNKFQMVQATWRVSPAEHCDTCIGRNGHTEVFYVGLDVEVPSVIGYQ